MPVAVIFPQQQGWYPDNTARAGEQHCWASASGATRRYEPCQRQSIYTKTGTPVRQVDRLYPGVTVSEKKLCRDLHSDKQAGQNSLGTEHV